MADDAQSIRSLNWRELFPFINLFRAFRVAIHPSKLVLGFALLVLVYCGGRVLDAIWPASNYAVSEEVDGYTLFIWSHEKDRNFSDKIEQQREANAAKYSELLLALDKEGFIKLDDKHLDAVMNDAKLGKFHSDL
ncbi:MAG TPA: hypothetical protein VFE47_28610, partial [Tepidisphaeraceae bacterium]|nr:hypothetical protein [Tepidisphaeraceae bacterium]